MAIKYDIQTNGAESYTANAVLETENVLFFGSNDSNDGDRYIVTSNGVVLVVWGDKTTNGISSITAQAFKDQYKAVMFYRDPKPLTITFTGES